jgi:beta-lactamase class A
MRTTTATYTLRQLLASLIIGCVLGSVCIWVLLQLPSTAKNNPFPLLDPGASTVHENDLLVRFQPLRDKLVAEYEQNPNFTVGLYFEYLPTGSNISVNNNLAMWPASLVKIPVAMAAMKKVESGQWQLSNELVILDEDKDSSFGQLYKQPTGTSLSIQTLLHASLVDSDNTAHFVLLRNIDAPELEDVFFHLGLDDFLASFKNSPSAQTDDNRMTAKTYSVFFRSLYNSTYLSPENSEQFLGFLADGRQEYARMGLPEEVVFAHKTGIRSDAGVWADSGIVYAKRRPYLLTIMLEKRDQNSPLTEADAAALFKTISSEIYSYVTTL